MYIDTHAHLMFPDFEKDLEEVLIRAKKAGVEKIINVACDPESAIVSLKMAQKFSQKNKNFEENKFPELFATIGLHPYDSDKYSPELFQKWLEIIKKDKNSKDSRIVAIGETGLDYFKCKIPKEIQKKSLEAHFELAIETHLPIILHNRDSDQDILDFLEKFSGKSNFKNSKENKLKAVIHCFDSTIDIAEKIWQLGHFTSFTGLITYPKNDRIREVIARAPLEQIMIETDSPYLAPQSERGKRNEPSFVPEVAKQIAEIKKLDLEEINSKLTSQSYDFFKII